MPLSINEHVTVKVPQLRGSISEIRRGQVVAVNPDRVTVQFPGEFNTKDFSVDQVTSAKDSFGFGGNVENPWEKPVQRLYK